MHLFLQGFQSYTGSILLGTLFAGANTLADHLSVQGQLHKELFIVVRAAFAYQLIAEDLILFLLDQLL